MNRDPSAAATAPTFVKMLLPSSASLTMCLCGATFFVAVHLLLNGLGQGTIFPALFGGQWAIDTAWNVLGSILQVGDSSVLGILCTALFWSLIGVAIYEILARVRRALTAQPSTTAPDVEVRPLRLSAPRWLGWRLGVGAVVVAVFLVAEPIFIYLLQSDIQVTSATIPSAHNIVTIVGIIAAWAAGAHALVVALRLYTLRVRLFRYSA